MPQTSNANSFGTLNPDIVLTYYLAFYVFFFVPWKFAWHYFRHSTLEIFWHSFCGIYSDLFLAFYLTVSGLMNVGCILEEGLINMSERWYKNMEKCHPILAHFYIWCWNMLEQHREVLKGNGRYEEYIMTYLFQNSASLSVILTSYVGNYVGTHVGKYPLMWYHMGSRVEPRWSQEMLMQNQGRKVDRCKWVNSAHITHLDL